MIIIDTIIVVIMIITIIIISSSSSSTFEDSTPQYVRLALSQIFEILDRGAENSRKNMESSGFDASSL